MENGKQKARRPILQLFCLDLFPITVSARGLEYEVGDFTSVDLKVQVNFSSTLFFSLNLLWSGRTGLF